MEKSLPSIDELKIEDLILKPQDITDLNITPENLFEIRISGNEYGTLEKKSLQEFLETSDDSSIEIRAYESKEWLSAISHPLFQRRRPEVLIENALNTINDQHFLLQNGERSGPYSLNELIERFENQELSVTDMISSNGRSGWQKLYEFNDFDRRSHGQLPHLPETNVFQNGPKRIQEDDPELAEMEAIVGLAYVSNIKSGMQEVNYQENQPQKKRTKVDIPIILQDNTHRNFKKPLLLLAGICFAVISYIFVANIPTTHGPKVTSSKAKTYKPTRAQTTIHKLKPQRSIAKARPRIRTVRPKIKKRANTPFKESAVYKKYKKQKSEEMEPTEIDPEEFEPEYPMDEVNLENDLDDVSEEEVQEFVKSIHGGFSIQSKDDFEDDGPESEKDLFDEELSY